MKKTSSSASSDVPVTGTTNVRSPTLSSNDSVPSSEILLNGIISSLKKYQCYLCQGWAHTVGFCPLKVKVDKVTFSIPGVKEAWEKRKLDLMEEHNIEKLAENYEEEEELSLSRKRIRTKK